MVRWQGLSRRTSSGARLKKHHEKKKRELGRNSAETLIGEERVREVRTRGNNLKLRALRLETCNLTDPTTGKSEAVKIIDVESNPANKEYTRRKVMTKGAIIRTEKGYAVVSNRPGQEGFISAVPTQYDVQKTQERTISAKKKKRQTIQRAKIGSASGTPKKTTTKPPIKHVAEVKPAPKPEPAKEETKESTKPPIKKATTTTKQTTTTTTKKAETTTTKKAEITKSEKKAPVEKKTAATTKPTTKKTSEKK